VPPGVLGGGPAGAAAGSPVAAPAARPGPGGPAAAADAPRPPAPSHSGKSNFPARAGFWGRRDSHGDIVPLTDPGLYPAGLIGWRSTILPHLLVVVASAALSFLAVMLVMKWRERPAPAPPPASAPQAPAPPAARLPPPAPAPLPQAAAAPSSRPRRAVSRPALPRGRRGSPGPDDPLPPRF
jgi:hypothetical protein